MSSAVFGPMEISKLSASYDAAISAVKDGQFGLSPLTLRRAVASLVIDEAKRGEFDPERVRDTVLARLGAAWHLHDPCTRPVRTKAYVPNRTRPANFKERL